MKRLFLLCVCLWATLSTAAFAKLNVVTSTSTAAAIAAAIGKSNIDVTSLTTGYEDLHTIEPRPSMVVKTAKADLVVVVGMELDGWMNGIISVAGKSSIKPGHPGYLDLSGPISKLEVPAPGSPLIGDVHRMGNPHYWISPENAIIIADQIRDALVRLDPANQTAYDQNFAQFSGDLKTAAKQWRTDLAPLKSAKLISVHSTWSYFLSALGLQSIGTVEPHPGFAPSPRQLADLVSKTRKRDYQILLIDRAQATEHKPYADTLKAAGISVCMLSQSVTPETRTYLNMMNANVKALVAAGKEIQ
ncbi:zinc ABC transporter substrate-binding protein [bacterium]|nr:zinc ABC transporter substrate-binding protein [bacterium]